MKAKDTIKLCGDEHCQPYCHEAQAEISFKAGTRKVAEFVNNLIIGVDNCKFEERLNGDKGCIVLDINENQWQAKLKEWGIIPNHHQTACSKK